MEFILVFAKILIFISGILFTGLFVERLVLQKYEVNIYVSFLIGIAIIYCIALIGIHLPNIVIFIYAVNLIGFYKYYKIIFKIRINKYILIISLPVLIAICFQMIWYWDAVAMWFFHAKVIAHAKMFAYEIYKHPTPPMPNYPKLLPIMAALISEITGVYNEALPKTALAFLLFGIILGFNEVKYFNNKEKIFIYFVLLSLMGIHSYSGYMDGWLAIYTVICCIFMVNLKKENSERDAANIICTIGILPMMKLEGQVIAIVLALFLLINNYKLLLNNYKHLLMLLTIIATPNVIWLYDKYEKGIYDSNSNIRTGFNEETIEIFFHRLEFDLGTIIYHFTIYSNLIYMFIMTIFVLLLITLKKLSIKNYVWIPLKISLIYFTLLFCITLINATGLSGFLEFGIRRFTMPIMMMMFIYNMMILKELKYSGDQK